MGVTRWKIDSVSMRSVRATGEDCCGYFGVPTATVHSNFRRGERFVLATDHDDEMERLNAKCKDLANCVKVADEAVNRCNTSAGLLRVIGDWNDAQDEIAHLKESLRKTENLLAASQELWAERDAEILERNVWDVPPSASSIVDEIAKRLRR